MSQPEYKKEPIGSIDSLSMALSIEAKELIRIANLADSFFYLHKRVDKPDGSIREIYGVENELKRVQDRIRKNIFCNIAFPHYLQGSIKDKESPRSYITNAKSHLNSKLLIGIDISNFYPSISAETIYLLWLRFFDFPKDVAEILTKLTTFQSFLPQGASTSPGLGNLVFWDVEDEIVQKLREEGYRYSRYVDDISVSTEKFVELSSLSPIFGMVFGMFKKRGVSPNRNKITISTAGHPMIIHNLNINSGRVTIRKNERNRIRKALKNCEVMYKENPTTVKYETIWRSVNGRILTLYQLHPSQAKTYITKVDNIRPVLSKSRIRMIERLASKCESLNVSQKEYVEIKRKLENIAQVHISTLKPYLDRIKLVKLKVYQQTLSEETGSRF